MRKLGILIFVIILASSIGYVPRAEAAISAQSPDTLSAVDAGTGWIKFAGVYTKDAPTTELWAENDQIYRSYLEFDISDIPDTATITGISLYVYKTSGGVACNFNAMANRPSITADAALYADCDDGTTYITGAAATTTGHNLNLGANAITDLQAQLAADWFAVGVVTASTLAQKMAGTTYATPAYRPVLTVTYTMSSGIYYTFNAAFENATVTTVNATFLSSDGSETREISTDTLIVFTLRPTYVTWEIGSGYYRRIYFTEDTGNMTLYVPEDTFSTFTVSVRDFTGVTSEEQTYLRSTRAINGTYETIEYVPITNTVNGIPLTLVVSRLYNLEVDTSETDYSFSFFSTTSVAAPILILTPPKYSDVLQFNSRYIHANYTRPTDTSITLAYTDDLANTSLVVMNIYTRDYTLIASWNTTLDNFSHTINALTNTTDYIAEALIYHDEYGNLTYRRVFSGAWSPPDAPDLSGLGTFGAINMNEVLGGVIIVMTAALFGAANAVGGLVITVFVAAVLTYYEWISIDWGVIVFVLAIALWYFLGRARI